MKARRQFRTLKIFLPCLHILMKTCLCPTGRRQRIKLFFPQSKCFWKKLCLSFLLAQRSCQDYSEPFQNGRQMLEGHHPFVFPCPSVLSVLEKQRKRIVIFSSSAGIFRMIIECGACLGLKLEVLCSRNIFLFISFHLLFRLSLWIFPTPTSTHEILKQTFLHGKCHIKEFSPKSKFSSQSMFKFWATLKNLSQNVRRNRNFVINSFVTEMNSSSQIYKR